MENESQPEGDEAEQDKELKEALEEIIRKTEEMEKRIDEILKRARGGGRKNDPDQ